VSDTTNTQSGGIGFFGLLTILFIALKLTGFIDWSWWWVLAPFWIPLCAVFAVAGIAFCIYLVVK
jgi:ABC-type polysaccharide/polyol phosphate export permease